MQHSWIQKYCFPLFALVIAAVTWHAVATRAAPPATPAAKSVSQTSVVATPAPAKP